MDSSARPRRERSGRELLINFGGDLAVTVPRRRVVLARRHRRRRSIQPRGSARHRPPHPWSGDLRRCTAFPAQVRRRYSHILDPTTAGRFVAHPLRPSPRDVHRRRDARHLRHARGRRRLSESRASNTDSTIAFARSTQTYESQRAGWFPTSTSSGLAAPEFRRHPRPAFRWSSRRSAGGALLDYRN